MEITVFVPKENNGLKTYIYGKKISKEQIPERGTLFKVTGTAVIFYYYYSTDKKSDYRRVYFIQNGDFPDKSNIPLVREEVRILFTAEGRKVDFIKKLLYSLQKKYTEDIYLLKTYFWQVITSFIELKKKSRDINKASEYYAEKYLLEMYEENNI